MDDLYSIAEIRAVVVNHRSVPDYLFDAYDKDSSDAVYLFDLLVMIIANAQGANAADPDFITFVREGSAAWHKWVILAKAFREWEKTLNSAKSRPFII